VCTCIPKVCFQAGVHCSPNRVLSRESLLFSSPKERDDWVDVILKTIGEQEKKKGEQYKQKLKALFHSIGHPVHLGPDAPDGHPTPEIDRKASSDRLWTLSRTPNRLSPETK